MASKSNPSELADHIDADTGARGGIYALAARLFDEPDPDVYAALADGSATEEFETLLDRTTIAVEAPSLAVDEDRETLAARYNDLFVIGYSEVIDKTDGTIDNTGPPVSLHEAEYRSEVSWNDVNLDLARAYEYFGIEVNQSDRRNHDHYRLQLEFMGYLCRREAAVDADLAQARLDFHDRHLRVVAEGVAEALDREPGTSIFGELASFIDRFSRADVEDLDTTINGGQGSE